MTSPPPYVVVVGGANMDLKARSTAPLVAGTSNPGSARMSPGGVGRNVAENLARLGTPVHLVAAVGADPIGDALLGETAAAGVGIERVRRLALPTGTYTAVLDSTGEMALAVADMAATDALGPDDVGSARELLAGAGLVVLDANLAPATLGAALDLATATGVRVVVDPVSVPKAERLAPLLDGRPVHTVTPNVAELAALTGSPTRSTTEVLTAARTLLARGVVHVWVRLGPAGSVLVAEGAEPLALARVDGPVADVTGAGDAMLAAYCHVLLAGGSSAGAAAFGQAAAALTVAVPETVRHDLTPALVAATLDPPLPERTP